MNQSLVKRIFFWTILCLTVGHRARARIACYDCNSMMDHNCEEINSKTPKKPYCVYCLKVRQQLDALDDQPYLTHRECVTGTAKGIKFDCEKREIRNSLKTDVCRCHEDLCNAAPAARDARPGNWLTLLLSLLATALGSGIIITERCVCC